MESRGARRRTTVAQIILLASFVDSVELAVIPVLLGGAMPVAPALGGHHKLSLAHHRV